MMEKASFLIAMPSLKESIFSRSVILMAEYKETGALGFIINLPTNTLVKDALKLLEVQNHQVLDIPILFGGPVQPEFFWAIHSPEFEAPTSMKVHPSFTLTSAIDLISVIDRPECPRIYHAGIGYSGWGEHQLDREIEEGSWWMGQFSLDLLFKVPHADRWNYAISELGADVDHFIDKSDPLDPVVN